MYVHIYDLLTIATRYPSFLHLGNQFVSCGMDWSICHFDAFSHTKNFIHNFLRVPEKEAKVAFKKCFCFVFQSARQCLRCGARGRYISRLPPQRTNRARATTFCFPGMPPTNAGGLGRRVCAREPGHRGGGVSRVPRAGTLTTPAAPRPPSEPLRR